MRAYLRVLEGPAFRNLWLAQTTSVVGDRLVIVALALFVTDLTGSATDVGLVLGAQTLPFVVFLLIGGVWADRLPRARLMIATDVVRAGLHALLAALIFTDVVEIWHLVAIEALFGTAEAFFRPAYTGLLPRTVPESEIQGRRLCRTEQPGRAHGSGARDRAGARGGRRMGISVRRSDVRDERTVLARGLIPRQARMLERIEHAGQLSRS
jgi:MFS family permease